MIRLSINSTMSEGALTEDLLNFIIFLFMNLSSLHNRSEW